MQQTLVICDWSGVLSYDRDFVHQGVNAVLKHYGKKKITLDELRTLMEGSVFDFYKKQGISDPEEAFSRFHVWFRDYGHPTPIPHALSTIETLLKRNIRVALFSSHPSQILQQEVVDYGYPKEIDVYGSMNKNFPNRVLEGFLESYPSDRVFYLGDTTIDIQLAHDHGIISVAVADERYAYHTLDMLQRASPHYIVQSICDISSVLNSRD